VEEIKDDGLGYTHPQRVEIYKQMLKEKSLNQFATWDKELHKLAFDSRFNILPIMADRKAIFEAHVRSLAEDHRNEKLEKVKVNVKEYQKLLEQEVKIAKTTFDSFKKKNIKIIQLIKQLM